MIFKLGELEHYSEDFPWFSYGQFDLFIVDIVDTGDTFYSETFSRLKVQSERHFIQFPNFLF